MSHDVTFRERGGNISTQSRYVVTSYTDVYSRFVPETTYVHLFKTIFLN